MYHKKFDYENSDFKIERNKDSIKYFIKVKKEFIEVSEDVFKVCRSSYDKIRYTYKNEVARSVLYYEDIDQATFLFSNDKKSIDDEIYIKDLVNLAINEINELPYKDKMIAQCIFLEEMSDRKTAKLLNIPKSTVTYRKMLLEKNFIDHLTHLTYCNIL